MEVEEEIANLKRIHPNFYGTKYGTHQRPLQSFKKI